MLPKRLQNFHEETNAVAAQLAAKARAVSDWLLFIDKLPAAESAFTAEWQHHQQIDFILEVAKFCRWLFPLGMIGVTFRGSLATVKYEFLALLALTVISWTLTLSSRLLVSYFKPLVSLASVVILSSSTLLAHNLFSDAYSIEEAVIVTQMYMGSLLFTIRIFPFRSPHIFTWAGVIVLAGVYAFGANSVVKLPDLVVVLTVISLIAVGFHYSWLHKLQQEASLEFTARQVIVEKEQSRAQALRSDIAKAGTAVDGLDVTTERVVAGRLKVSTYQRRYAALGGDWASCYTFKDGRGVVLVADATGKGVQAALVINALKAMWATAIQNDRLDPMSWLAGVNKVFYQLGHKQDHTLTLGLIVAEGDILTYYSAGHLPVFVVARDATEEGRVEFIHGRGMPLGIASELDIEPAASLTKVSEMAVAMLGTDGVFERGIRTRKREILRLKLDFERSGQQALESIPQHDDQLVVVMRPAA